MTDETMQQTGGPVFKTAQEHDVYIMGLVCGALGSFQGWCENPALAGCECVEDVLVNLSAYLETAREYGEESFEQRVKDELGGTRISVQALINAWETGYRAGLAIKVAPLPSLEVAGKKAEVKK